MDDDSNLSPAQRELRFREAAEVVHERIMADIRSGNFLATLKAQNPGLFKPRKETCVAEPCKEGR